MKENEVLAKKHEALIKNLNLADALAELAALEPGGVNAFRQKHPDFIPNAWWEGPTTKTDWLLWQEYQKTLVRVWRENFPIELAMRLIVAGRGEWDFMEVQNRIMNEVAGTSGVVCESGLSAPLSSPLGAQVQREVRQIKLAPDLMEETIRVYPYQIAVAFLLAEPWRALFCGRCGRPFVIEKNRGTYCSAACSDIALRDNKKRSYRKHGGFRRSKGHTARLPGNK